MFSIAGGVRFPLWSPQSQVRGKHEIGWLKRALGVESDRDREKREEREFRREALAAVLALPLDRWRIGESSHEFLATTNGGAAVRLRPIGTPCRQAPEAANSPVALRDMPEQT